MADATTQHPHTGAQPSGRRQMTLADLILSHKGAAEFISWAGRVHITVERIDDPIPVPEVSESDFGEFTAARGRA